MHYNLLGMRRGQWTSYNNINNETRDKYPHLRDLLVIQLHHFCSQCIVHLSVLILCSLVLCAAPLVLTCRFLLL
jgi:hypothetical protein